MMGAMAIRRVVPNLLCRKVEDTRGFYEDLLGFKVAMDMGWIVTLVSPEMSTAQISLSEGVQEPPGDHPVLTIEVTDVDDVHQRALDSCLEISMSLRDEDWGVRRFFVRDPDGRVVNVMGHQEAHG